MNKTGTTNTLTNYIGDWHNIYTRGWLGEVETNEEKHTAEPNLIKGSKSEHEAHETRNHENEAWTLRQRLRHVNMI